MAFLARFSLTLALVGALTTGTRSVAAETDKGPVSLAMARHLVAETLKPQDAGAEIDAYRDKYSPEYYFFEVGWNNPNGSMISAHYAVDSFSAEIWDVEGSVCSRPHSRGIARLQRSIRERLALGKDKLKTRENKKPLACTEGVDEEREDLIQPAARATFPRMGRRGP